MTALGMTGSIKLLQATALEFSQADHSVEQLTIGQHIHAIQEHTQYTNMPRIHHRYLREGDKRRSSSRTDNWAAQTMTASMMVFTNATFQL